jgi:hypothetical protein
MMLPQSILEMRKLIAQDDNKGAKMDAIRHLHSSSLHSSPLMRTSARFRFQT